MKDCGEFVILGDSGKLTMNLFTTLGFYAKPSNGWAEVQITAETPGFRADFYESILFWELDGLREDLRRMHTELKGEATWQPVGSFLDLKAVMNKMGHIHWSVELTRLSESMATLYFEMNSDQSYLPTLIDQIDAILTATQEHGDP